MKFSATLHQEPIRWRHIGRGFWMLNEPSGVWASIQPVHEEASSHLYVMAGRGTTCARSAQVHIGANRRAALVEAKAIGDKMVDDLVMGRC